jgi:hypothetical protein
MIRTPLSHSDGAEPPDMRHRPLARRALSNRTGRARMLVASLAALFCGLCWLLNGGCGRGGSHAEALSMTPEARVGRLVDILTPLDKTVTSDVSDARFHKSQDMLAELSSAGPEVGRAALHALQERKEKVVDIERGLITVAAKSDTQETLPLLEKLVTQYGAAIDLRTEATLLIAEVAPERAWQLLQPMVTQQRPDSTTAPAEFLLRAFVTACEKTGRSPVKELANVATNLFQDEAARVRAVKELGKYSDPLAEQALRTILIESTGDGYLRRMAAQSIVKSLPRESACDILKQVADHEAELNMLQFLMNVIDQNCQ